jgi:Transglycosylase SLT domain
MRRRENRAPFLSNKKVYICCLAIAMLAASPMRAADASATSSLLTPRADTGKVSVVRVDRRTGKLVRTISGGESSQKSTPLALPPAHIQELVEKSAREHNVDPLLVQSVIQVENNHFAVSPKGAEGLMQLMPGTARMLGVSNSFDPAENIEAGVKYLRYLQSLYQDDRLALAAYNAGPKAVDKYKGTPPFQETQDYVNQVGQRYQKAKRDEAVKNAAQPAAPALVEEMQPPAEEQHPKVERIIDLNARPVLKTAQE